MPYLKWRCEFGQPKCEHDYLHMCETMIAIADVCFHCGSYCSSVKWLKVPPPPPIPIVLNMPIVCLLMPFCYFFF